MNITSAPCVNMNITSAQYVKNIENKDVNSSITAIIDGRTMSVPLDSANRHYAEIMRQVKEGTLTLKEAE